MEIQSLLDRKIVSSIPKRVQPKFVSNVFLRPKPNGKFRLISDLSTLNDDVIKKHFKMTHLDTAINLISEGAFMGSIDLSDAYYSVSIHPSHRGFLAFAWEGALLQFNALPFGLTSAPRIFTKLLKPVFCDFRTRGHEGFVYLDDSFVIGKSKEECQKGVDYLVQSLSSLGFRIHEEKSALIPAQELTFLGYVLNSVELTVTPNGEKSGK